MTGESDGALLQQPPDPPVSRDGGRTDKSAFDHMTAIVSVHWAVQGPCPQCWQGRSTSPRNSFTSWQLLKKPLTGRHSI